jgi:hypothetical protein
MTRYAARLAVATLVAAAVGLGVPAPAEASTCSSGTGVSVVVDFHELGGGVQTFCDAGGAGKTADAQLREAGHELTYVQRQPGFICRIDDKPVDDPCVNTPPADAYWSLWWSDGRSGKWSYSSQGASSLKVPEGGYVGMSWQGSDDKSQPGAAPTPHATQPSSSPPSQSTSSPHPSTAPGQAPPSSTGPGSTSPSSGTTATSPRSAGRHAKQQDDSSRSAKAHGKASRGPDQTQAGEPLGQVATTAGAASDSGGSGSGGLPGWVAPVAIAVLFVGAGTIALVRRKSSGGA